MTELLPGDERADEAPPHEPARRRPRSWGRVLLLALVAATVLALVLVLVVRSSWWGGFAEKTGARVACLRDGRSAAPGGSWCSIYRQDFDDAVPLGGFVNATPDDWYLHPDNPYAKTLRSYPDSWATTDKLSQNQASRTTEVVSSAEGASGVLRLHGHSEQVDGKVQALGGSFYPVIRPLEVTNHGQVSQTYGRYSVRFRATGGYVPTASGGFPSDDTTTGRYGTAFLLWPVDDNWSDGEIDYPEMAWSDHVSGYVHTIGRPQVNSSEFELPQTTTSWNTATIEWSPDLLVFSLNDVEVYRTTRDVPSTPMRWGFQSGGTLGVPPAQASGELLVDWVRIDAYDPHG